MNKRIFEDSTNYTATIVKLHTMQDVPGLDNLKSVTVFGNQCLIGKDSNLNDLYVYFPAECKLSDDFLRYNNLYRHSELNFNTAQKGFFDESGRVKAIKFKGVISTCFVMPINSLLHFVNTDDLELGDEFNEVGGVEICRKYKVVNQQSQGGGKESRYNKKLNRFDKLVPNQFRFHTDTAQLARNLHVFNPEDIIVISAKWHGTSAIFANVLIRAEVPWYRTLINKILNGHSDVKKYGNLYGSRTVIKNEYINKEVTPGYYNEDIWGTVNKELEGKIEEGITIYGEIVGFLASGKHIQKGYDYGCSPVGINVDQENEDNLIGVPHHKFVVYRITYTKPNGEVIEFCDEQINLYCKKYNLERVKVLYKGKLSNFWDTYCESEHWQENFLNQLQASWSMEKDCPYCNNKVPFEGLVVRIDGKETYSAYKLKAKKFLAHETKELDAGEVNIEDNQTTENEHNNN